MNPMSYWQQMDGVTALLHFLPFGLLLFSTAAFPFIPGISHWWESMGNKFLFAGACALAGVFLYLRPSGDITKVLETYLDYLAFLALWVLFLPSAAAFISQGHSPGCPISTPCSWGWVPSWQVF